MSWWDVRNQLPYCNGEPDGPEFSPNSYCHCDLPTDVHNGVCGKCLFPLTSSVFDGNGQLIRSAQD